ncbi:hypothetical protein OPQ81_001698 [Rhizoctonia solani]|nr:hypothetical protein OPQ81_001698 [Rhizoctonia solani]
MSYSDRPTARGRVDYPTPGLSVPHPKEGDKVGFRVGNQWVLCKVFEIDRAPEAGSMSGGLYTLRTPQSHFKGDNMIITTRENIQFPPEGGEGVVVWDVIA